jgi:preprotein translocase subunit SecA
MRQVEKAVMLQTLDTEWRDHVTAMAYLRQGIQFRGYGQQDPTREYRREAFEIFLSMLASSKQEVVTTLAQLRLQTDDELRIRPRIKPRFAHSIRNPGKSVRLRLAGG